MEANEEVMTTLLRHTIGILQTNPQNAAMALLKDGVLDSGLELWAVLLLDTRRVEQGTEIRPTLAGVEAVGTMVEKGARDLHQTHQTTLRPDTKVQDLDLRHADSLRCFTGGSFSKA